LNGKPVLQDHKLALAILIYLAMNDSFVQRDTLVHLIWDIGSSQIKKGRNRLTDQLGTAKSALSPSIFDAYVEENLPDRMLHFIREQAVSFDTDAIDALHFSLIHPTFGQLDSAIGNYGKLPFLYRFTIDGKGYDDWEYATAKDYEEKIFHVYKSLIIGYLKHADKLSLVNATLQQWKGLKPTLVQPTMMSKIAEFDVIFQALANGFEASMESYFNAVAELRRIDEAPTEQLDLIRTLVRDNQESLHAALFTKLYPDVASPVNLPVNLAKPPPPYYVEMGDIEQNIVTQLKDNAHHRIVCLVGMHGVGKTTLADYIIKTHADQFEAIFTSDLSVDEPYATLARWMYAIGQIPDPNNFQTSGMVFRHAIGSRQVLVFLDDVQNIEQIELFVPNGRTTSVLVTTNQRSVATHLKIEYSASVIERGLFSPAQSSQLMRKILPKQVGTIESKHIRNITKALDHLPLGIVLIAKRISSILTKSTLGQVADALATLDRQSKGLREISPIADALKIGWELNQQPDLSDVFSVLGVFGSRSFNDEAVTYLVDKDVDIESILRELISLSLVNVDYDTGRYNMHVLIAHFAREQLGEQLTELELRLSVYYAELVQDVIDIEHLALEVDNILVAIDIAYRHEAWQNVMVLTDSLEEFWVIRGRFDEAIETFQKALTAALALQDTRKEASYYLQLGNMHLQKNELVLAEQHLYQCYAMVDLLDDEGLLGDVLIYMGRLEIEKENYDEAKRHLEMSIGIQEELGDLNKAAYAKFLLAHYYYYRGQFEDVEQLVAAALDQHERDGDLVGQIRTWQLLALVAYNQKRFEDSRIWAETALALCESIHEYNEYTIVLNTLSLTYINLEDYTKALTINSKAIKILKVIDDVKNLARSYISRSQIFLGSNKLHPALHYVNHSLKIYTTLNYRSVNGEVRCHNFIGDIHLKGNDIPNACKSWLEALRLVKEHIGDLNGNFWIPFLEEKLQRHHCFD
jgi:tetratricopeptide (TPR) repeat protein